MVYYSYYKKVDHPPYIPMKFNHTAIIVTVIIQQILGFIWYSSALFGDAWAGGLGKTLLMMTPSDPTPYVVAVIGSLLFCYFLSWLLRVLDVRAPRRGARLGALVWLGAMLPALVVHYAFLGIALPVILIDTGGTLVNALVAGALLTSWKR